MQNEPRTLSVEEVAPFFLDDDVAVVMPSYRLFRVDGSGNRYYYTSDESGQPTFYMSVTSFLSSVMPTSQFLTDWRVRLGKEESEEAARIAACYGTYLHILIGQFMREGVYDHGNTPLALDEYMRYEGIPARYYGPWLEDLESDMLAFAAFAVERKLRPLAIEFPVCHPAGLAGMIDLVGIIEFNRRDVVAVIDFKSGRKGFWDSHEAQLHTYRMMWNELFRGTAFEAEMVFNWSPKAWRTAPTYDLKNQTDSVQAANVPHYIQLFQNQGLRTPSKKFVSITEPLRFGESLEGKYQVRSLEDFITEKNRELCYEED